MNKIYNGDVACGAPNSVIRCQQENRAFRETLKKAHYALEELRGYFVPNDEQHVAIIAYNDCIREVEEALKENV